MAQYRTLEPVTYVKDGKVVSVAADRVVELNDKQAQSLAGRVSAVEDRGASMFPDGAPVINPTITRDVPVPAFSPTPVEPAPAPEPEKKSDRVGPPKSTPAGK